jgi:type IV pilus assembly protein PilP
MMNLAKTNFPFKLLLLLLPVALVTGCSNDQQMLDAQSYVSSVVNRAPGNIDPPPEFISYVAFTYSAASLRGPFDIPVDASTVLRQQNNEVKPDETRPKEYLEGFAVGALNMVGTLARNGQVWALIKDDTNNISRVTLGNYMGHNYGRITAITDTRVEMVEIVPTGDGGWIERPQAIAMLEQ